MDKLVRPLPKKGDIYRHFKNKYYQINQVCLHTETKEPMVSYTALYGERLSYVRPLSMFMEKVDTKKYPLANQEYRFERVEDLNEMKCPIVTLCGSTKFRGIFDEVIRDLTIEGNIVLAPTIFTHAEEDIWENVPKEQFDEMVRKFDIAHKQMIDMCDYVYVINPYGYIGESTRNEIEYAKMTNKHISYYCKEDDKDV